MRTIFRQELQTLHDDLVRLAQHAAVAMTKAAEALTSGDIVLAEQVIDADERINGLERRLDERAISLLALQAPVAGDLRLVVTVLRLSATLERMGDLAEHVAFTARGRYPDAAVGGPAHATLLRMAEEAVRVANDVVTLVREQDIETADQIEAKDDILDDLHRETFKMTLDDSLDFTRQELVDTVLLGRFLERFGDQGVNVAHRMNYLITGFERESAPAAGQDGAAAGRGEFAS